MFISNRVSQERCKAVLRTITFFALIQIVCLGAAAADTRDFGGSPDAFKGGGDKTPPRCQINVPRAATAPFFVKWDCSDDTSSDDQIRTELWVTRKGARIPVKVADFLGFPASVFIDEGILQSATVAEGLPASFRLLARDRAGIATFSPVQTVQNQDNSVSSCDLQLVTDNTEADGGTTGLPTMTVTVIDASVATSQRSASDVTIATGNDNPATASPCEIPELCDEEMDTGDIVFVSTINIEADNDITGTLVITPGDVEVNLEGTAQVSDSILASINSSGTTVIDGVVTNVTFNCE